MNLIPQSLKDLYKNDSGTLICGIFALIAFIYHIVNISYSYCNTSVALCKTPVVANTSTVKNVSPVSTSKDSLVMDIKCDSVPAGELDSPKTSKYLLGTVLSIFAVLILIATYKVYAIMGIDDANNNKLIYYSGAGLLLIVGIVNIVTNIGIVKVTGMVIWFALVMLILYNTLTGRYATNVDSFLSTKGGGIISTPNILFVLILAILAGAFAFNLYTFTAGYIEYGLANMVNIIVILAVIVAISHQVKLILATAKGTNRTGIWYMVTVLLVLLALLGHMIYMLYHCKFQTYDCEPDISVMGDSVHIHCKANI